MIVVTAAYTYNLDIPLDEWEAMSENEKYDHLASNPEPDGWALEVEEV